MGAVPRRASDKRILVYSKGGGGSGREVRTNDGEEVSTPDEPPKGAPIESLPERPEEFAPGLTPELLDMVEAVKRFK